MENVMQEEKEAISTYYVSQLCQDNHLQSFDITQPSVEAA
jgi:hypothetical protein